MTSSVRILTSYSLDSTPSVLLIAPNGDKTLVNCGEGCQRSFLESPGLRVRTVNRVCLTHLGHDAVGGLPGMVLTTADVTETTLANIVQAESTSNGSPAAKRKEHPPSDQPNDVPPDLDVVGPAGTQAFLHSLRHFMRRDKFQIRAIEGEYYQKPGEQTSSGMSSVGKRARKRQEHGDAGQQPEAFLVQTVPAKQQIRPKHSGNFMTREILSFVFTTPRVKGKFLPGKARELKIPPGPLYAKLKSGQSVTFVDDVGQERTVQSHEVVEKDGPSVAVVVLYCPTEEVLSQLKKSSVLSGLQQPRAEDSVVVDVVVHLTPAVLFQSVAYKKWRDRFSDAEHIWLETYERLVDAGDRMATVQGEPSPFRAAALGAFTRSLLSSELYPSPLLSINDCSQEVSSIADAVIGRPGLEYILIPRAKKGLNTASLPIGPSESDIQEARRSCENTGARELAQRLTKDNVAPNVVGNECPAGELVFTGTGSALPCKHRNVTGMCMQMSTGNSLILDIGEGTIGQLLRMKFENQSSFEQVLLRIKAVWISHPHADHHLGLLRLLAERSCLRGTEIDPLVLMAPRNLFQFMAEYCEVYPAIKGTYVALECQDMTPGNKHALFDKLNKDLGITGCFAIPVMHCPHAYALVIDGTPFGRAAYSGDCRPSMQFAEAAVDAGLLIHEATFEDGMEEEAVLKRHSTVSEALTVGRKMRARHVVLTHFSQRYPRIPPLRDGHAQGISVSFAFDFMRLTPSSLDVASQLTSALRLIYPADDSTPDESDSRQGSKVTAAEILSVPGLFARNDLL